MTIGILPGLLHKLPGLGAVTTGYGAGSGSASNTGAGLITGDVRFFGKNSSTSSVSSNFVKADGKTYSVLQNPSLSKIYTPHFSTAVPTVYDTVYIYYNQIGNMYFRMNSSYALFSSPDFINWTSCGVTLNGNRVLMYYVGNRYFIGTSGGNIFSSSDGINWTSLGISCSTTGYLNNYSVCYGNGVWVLAGAGVGLFYSTTGNSFTSFYVESSAGTSATYYGASFIPSTNTFVCMIYSYNAKAYICYYSNTGTSWSSATITSVSFSAYCTQISNNAGVFLGSGFTNNGYTWISSGALSTTVYSNDLSTNSIIGFDSSGNTYFIGSGDSIAAPILNTLPSQISGATISLSYNVPIVANGLCFIMGNNTNAGTSNCFIYYSIDGINFFTYFTNPIVNGTTYGALMSSMNYMGNVILSANYLKSIYAPLSFYNVPYMPQGYWIYTPSSSH